MDNDQNVGSPPSAPVVSTEPLGANSETNKSQLPPLSVTTTTAPNVMHSPESIDHTSGPHGLGEIFAALGRLIGLGDKSKSPAPAAPSFEPISTPPSDATTPVVPDLGSSTTLTQPTEPPLSNPSIVTPTSDSISSPPPLPPDGVEPPASQSNWGTLSSGSTASAITPVQNPTPSVAAAETSVNYAPPSPTTEPSSSNISSLNNSDLPK